MVQSIVFWLLAILTVAAALAVVVQRNIFRAALTLVLCFLTVAGLFITLSADFLAVVQILIYVGGISILIVLAIMLTRDVQMGSPSNKLKIPALIAAVLFLGVIGFAMLSTPWQLSDAAPVYPTTQPLAGILLGQNGFVLTVQITAALLLAVVLGAIAVMREK